MRKDFRSRQMMYRDEETEFDLQRRKMNLRRREKRRKEDVR